MFHLYKELGIGPASQKPVVLSLEQQPQLGNTSNSYWINIILDVNYNIQILIQADV